jgi:hypothetical protein
MHAMQFALGKHMHVMMDDSIRQEGLLGGSYLEAVTCQLLASLRYLEMELAWLNTSTGYRTEKYRLNSNCSIGTHPCGNCMEYKRSIKCHGIQKVHQVPWNTKGPSSAMEYERSIKCHGIQKVHQVPCSIKLEP